MSPRKKTKARKSPSRAVAIHRPQPQQITVARTGNPVTDMMGMIAAAATNRSVDTGKMREMLDMQKELMAMQAERQFNESMKRAQEEIPAISRDKKGENHKYAPLEKIDAIAAPIYQRHGFSLSYGMADSTVPAHYRITCKVSHVGHSRDYFIDLPSDLTGPKGGANKTGVQAAGSTSSYGRRYLLVMIFNIRLVGEDDDGNLGRGAGPVTAEQLAAIRKRLREIDGMETDFCNVFELDRIENLPASKYAIAMSKMAEAAKRKGMQISA